jgi:hypothetical protein
MGLLNITTVVASIVVILVKTGQQFHKIFERFQEEQHSLSCSSPNALSLRLLHLRFKPYSWAGALRGQEKCRRLWSMLGAISHWLYNDSLCID